MDSNHSNSQEQVKKKFQDFQMLKISISISMAKKISISTKKKTQGPICLGVWELMQDKEDSTLTIYLKGVGTVHIAVA